MSKILGVSEKTVMRLAHAKLLSHVRIGKLFRFELAHVEEFKQKSTVEATSLHNFLDKRTRRVVYSAPSHSQM